MAFLHSSARPHQPILGLRRPSCRPSTTVLTLGANVSSIHQNFRFKTAVSSQVRQSWFAVFASNTNLSDRDTPSKKSDEIKASDAGQGPPLATILAGLLVFLLICWIIGSILMWLQFPQLYPQEKC